MTISPNMNLVVSTVAVDSGLAWETNLNASLSIIDSHNHSAGQGVQIQPAGININSDLAFGGNNAISLRSTRFLVQGSPISGASDVGCLYVSGVDLYFNDENGNQIKMTAGGLVNATSSGISSGTNSASFVSNVLVVNAAATTPANIQVGSVLLGNNSANSKFLTLSPPSAMASNFTLTLPTIPASQNFLSIDASGNIGAYAPVSAGITGSNIAAATVTRSNQVAVGQQISSSSGGFSTSSTSAVNVTNLTVTITTSGRPVVLLLQSDGTANQSFIGFGSTTSTGVQTGTMGFLRGGSLIAESNFSSNVTGTFQATQWPASSFQYLDVVAAGTYTYTVQAFVNSTNFGLAVFFTKLVAYEL
jgi:hypothetical protein